MSGGSRYQVARSEEFDDGQHEIVDVDGVEVGVLRHDGEYFAFRNDCPHQGGPVCTGKVTNRLEGRYVGPGQRVQREVGDQGIVSCPLHGWSFDLATGENIADPSIVLPSYDVVVEDGVVYLDRGE